jgi:hypothetical protein
MSQIVLQTVVVPVTTSLPFFLAGVTLCLSSSSAWALCKRRVWTTLVWPLMLGKWRGVEPDEPNMGAEVL